MTGEGRVLVDTSAWIEFFRTGGHAETQAAVREVLDAGRAVLCDLVLVELWNGARGDRQPRILATLAGTLELLPTSEEVWSTARDLARATRSSGITVPATDLVIAACGRVHGVELLHRDGHFDLLGEVEVAGEE